MHSKDEARNPFSGRTIAIAVVAALVVLGGVYLLIYQTPAPGAKDFVECVAAGNPVMGSYPRQCTTKDGTQFTEDIGNESDKADLIRLTAPRPNQTTKSPPLVTCTQEAKLCPDGSYVGRTGPNCEFATCPQEPIGRQCNGANDTSCPTGYSCVQECGPLVAREGDPPPSSSCQPKGYERRCPVCLSKDTMIDTPLGAVAVQDVRVGSPVWTTSVSGARIPGFVGYVGKTPVPPTHMMVHLTLDDGRTVLVSPGHPTSDGRTVGELATGDAYDSARVATATRVTYNEGFTYDLLPSGQSGFYWANGILLDSTLR